MLNILGMKLQSEDLKDLCFMLPVASIFSLVVPFNCVSDLCARRIFFWGIHNQPSGVFPRSFVNATTTECPCFLSPKNGRVKVPCLWNY